MAARLIFTPAVSVLLKQANFTPVVSV